MNYLNYMNEMESLLSKIDERQKDEILLEWARKKYESKREQLLKVWKDSMTPSNKKAETDQKITEHIKNLKESDLLLLRSFDGKVSFYDCLEVEYDDIDDVLKVVENFIEIANLWMEIEDYEQAYNYFHAVLYTHFRVKEDEYEEYTDIWKLGKYEDLNYSFYLLIYQSIYCLYQMYDGEYRSYRIFEVISTFIFYIKSIEGFMLIGKHRLSGLDKFWEEWALFLADRRHPFLDSFLTEACQNLFGIDRMKKVLLATDYQEAWLSEKLCEQLFYEDRKEESLKEAMFIIIKFDGSSEVCGTLAQFQLEHQESTLLKPFRLELLEILFRNKPNPENYVNYIYSGIEINRMKETMANVLNQIDHPEKQHFITESEKDVYVVKFLHGDFEEVYAMCSDEKNGIGWSTKITGQVLPYCLMLLHQETKIPEFLIDMVQDGFWNPATIVLLEKWRKEVDVSNFYQEKWTTCLKTQCDEYVEDIMKNQTRYHYGKAAHLIVVLGLALDSCGACGYDEFVSEYRKKYKTTPRFLKQLNVTEEELHEVE